MNVVHLASRRSEFVEPLNIDYEAMRKVVEAWAQTAQTEDDRATIALLLNFTRDLAVSPSFQKQFDGMLRDFFCDYCVYAGDVLCQGKQANVPCHVLSDWYHRKVAYKA